MIDFHTHPVLIKELVDKDSQLREIVRKVFNLTYAFQPLEIFHLQMDAAGIDKAVLLPIDCLTTRNCQIFSNEHIAKLCKLSKRFIGFASVDPHQKKANQALRFAVNELGLRGLKLDPGLQEFYPNNKELVYPLYEEASMLGIPTLFHMGISWESKVMVKYSRPLYLEDVAYDFPQLNIVIAHFGWPWVLDSIALALKYPNVYIDTSAHYLDSPKDFLEFVMTKQIPKTAVERSLRRKILFGSNYPRIEIRKMVEAIKALGFSKETQDMVFHVNAKRLLNY